MLPQPRLSIFWQDAEQNFVADRVDLSAKSLDNYHHFLSAFSRHCKVSVDQVGRLHLLAFLQRYDNPRSYNVMLCKARGFFSWAADYYNIPDPTAKLRQKKVIDPPQPRIITEAEYARIVAAKGVARDRCVFLANTGLRAAEFCNMQVIGHTVSVLGKGGKRRVVPLNQTAYNILPRIKISKSNITLYSSIRRFGDRIGIIGLHPHSLRHYFATRLVSQQAALADVAKLLGHSDIKTTIEFYYHPDDLGSVVELLDS